MPGVDIFIQHIDFSRLMIPFLAMLVTILHCEEPWPVVVYYWLYYDGCAR